MKKLILLSLMCVAAAWGYTPIQVGPLNCTAGTGSLVSGNQTCTLASSVPSGSVIIAVGGMRTSGTATGVSSVTDNLSTPTVYTQKLISGTWNNTNINGSIMFAGTTTVSGTPTLTFHITGTYSIFDIGILVYDGSQITENLAGTKAAFGGVVTSMSCGAFTPTAPNALVVAGIYDNNNTAGVPTAFSGMVNQLVATFTGNTRKLVLQDASQTTAVSITPGITDTAAGGSTFACVAAAFQPVSTVPSLSTITPNTGVAGSTYDVTLAGSVLTGSTSITVSGSGVTVTNLAVVNSANVTATFAIDIAATTGARNVTITSPGGTSNAITFTITGHPAGAPIQVGPSNCVLNPSGNPAVAGTGSVTCAFGHPVLSGSVIVVAAQARLSAANDVTSITDTLSTSYGTTVSATHNSTTGVWLFAGKTTAAGANTVTVTFNGSYFFGWVTMLEYHGSELTTTTAGSNQANGAFVSPLSCGAFTPSVTNAEVIGAIYNTATGSVLPAVSPMVNLITGNDSNYRQATMQAYFMAVQTSISPGQTSGSPQAWTCAAVALQTASSSSSARRRQAIIGRLRQTDSGVSVPVAQDWSIAWLGDQHPDPTSFVPINVNSAYLLTKVSSWNIKAFAFVGDTNNLFPAGTYNHGWNDLVATGLPTITSVGNHDCLIEDCAGPVGALRTTVNRTAVWDGSLGYSSVSGATYGPVTSFTNVGNDLGYYPDPTGSRANYAIRFVVNGHKFLFIALEIFPRDDVMTWAANLAAVYPDHKVAYVTHAYQLSGSGAGVRPCRYLVGPPPISDSYCAGNGGGYDLYLRNDGVTFSTGEVLRDNLIYTQANSFLSLNGHFISVSPRYSQSSNVGTHGNNIISLMLNDQEKVMTTNNTVIGRIIFHESTAKMDFLIYDSATDTVLVSILNLTWDQ